MLVKINVENNVINIISRKVEYCDSLNSVVGACNRSEKRVIFARVVSNM